MLFARFLWPNNFMERAGLKTDAKGSIVSLGVFIIVLFSSFFIIKNIAEAKGISLASYKGFSHLGKGFFHTLGQTLNEEIVLGALLLFGLKRLFKKMSIYLVAFLVALIFAALHYLFYQVVEGGNQGSLTLLALTNLLLIGLIRNIFILAYRNIYFAWAIHLGWNAIMFSSLFNFPANESVRFNFFVGSWQTTVFIAVLGLVLCVIRCKPKSILSP